MSNRAWVTLATNDSYGLGALVLAHSLRRVGSAYPAVVLITPSVTEAMRDRLRAVFAEVVTVDVLDSRDAAHLALLQRPELGITFTKIHCWNLTQYDKCVFLDADTLVVQNSDELFDREELSAAPDVGWPDCFNSGVFVYTPSADTFSRLVQFAQERGSFDGGDQGLLNSFFSDWAHGDINKHLPFLYNVTSAAFYSYMPALKHYGQNLKIIHFIGAAKPWLQHFNWESRAVDAPEHLRQFLQLWWDLFVVDVHAQLDVSMSGVAGNLARVTLGSSQREAIDELTRRQGWEAGNIDYMGVDSFDNIWAKISQTLSQGRPSPPKQSPPKEPTPPQTAPVEVEVITGEIAQEPVTDPIELAKEVVPTEETIPVQEPEVITSAVSSETAPLSNQQTAQIESLVQSETSALTDTSSVIETSLPIIEANVVPEVSAPASVVADQDVISAVQTQSVPEVPAESLPLTTAEPVVESVTATETPATSEEPILTEALKPAEKVTEPSPISEAPVVDETPVTVADTVIAEVVAQAPEIIAQSAVVDVPVSEIPVSGEANTFAKIPSTDITLDVEPVLAVSKEKTEVLITEGTTEGSVEDSVKVVSADTKPQTEIVPPEVEKKTEAQVTETTSVSIPVKDSSADIESQIAVLEAKEKTEATVITSAPVEPVAEPVKVPSTDSSTPVEPTLTEVKEKTDIPAPVQPTLTEVKEKTDIPAPVEPVVEAAKVAEPVQIVPTLPIASPVCPIESTPEKSVPSDSASDSPPLANTPSKEEIPDVSAAKSAERRKPAGKLQLSPPVAPDPLPTPDSELEDAASLAQSIIASELRTPTVTSPGSATSPSSPPAPLQHSRLSVDEPEVPTPPVGAVSLAQIGVKTKGKTSTAAQIESSVTEKPESATSTATEPAIQKTETAPAEVPKKKVVKKVVKKVSAASGDTPVPPPRKKEKKPKE